MSIFDTVVSDIAPLSGTKPLRMQGDLAAQMVRGIGKFLMREIKASVARREAHWNRDLASHENYVKSLEANRQRFLKVIGAIDPREPVEMHLLATTSQSALVGEGVGYEVFAVRWNALKGVDLEGLLRRLPHFWYVVQYPLHLRSGEVGVNVYPQSYS